MIRDNRFRSPRGLFCSGRIAGLVFVTVLVGCGRQAREMEQTGKRERPSKSGEARTAGNVEPGTMLAESRFKQTLRDTGAKYVVIQVYMEACGPCMTEALHLTRTQEEWRKAGVAILGLGMDETPEGPQAFYRHTGQRITYPLYLAPWFAEQQEVFMTPTVFVYSADGEQLFRTDPETAKEGIMAALGTKLAQLLDE